MNILDFKEITPDNYNVFKNCTGDLYCNSESSFATMYMWQHYSNVKYFVNNNTIFSLFKNKNGQYESFMPYGVNAKTISIIEELTQLYDKLQTPLTINLCTEDFIEFLISTNKYKFSVIEKRDSFDYVYYTEELINLNGKKFHSKRNHINSFTKKYSYDYIKYNNSMKNECLNFCSEILKKHYGFSEKDYKTEFISISKTFDNIDKFGLKCGIITIDNKIVALSVGERLNNDYALIHIEKADYNYRTAYTVINNLFLKNEFSDTIYVNREEDMGIEGLRIAKQSYNPCKMIKKYTVKFD